MTGPGGERRSRLPGAAVLLAGLALAALVIVLAVNTFNADLFASNVPPPPLPPLTELPEGRGLDWSHAGYRDGREPIPSPDVSWNVVTDFGAVGDGDTDDTEALQAAVAAAHERARGGVVFLPAGTYKLTQQLNITRSNVIIRGAGEDRTTIYIPLALSDVYEGTWSKNDDGTVDSRWLFHGGFLSIIGRRARSSRGATLLATVDGSVKQGARIIPVDSTSAFKLGQRIRVFINDVSTAPPSGSDVEEEGSETPGDEEEQEDGSAQRGTAPKGSIAAFVYGDGLANSGQPGTLSTDDISVTAKVASIGDDWVALDRELPFPVERRWKGTVHESKPTVEDSGIEELTIRFKHTTAPAHLTERGYNALYLEDVFNVWVRSVTILNADNGIKMRGVDHATLSDLTFNVTASRWSRRASKEEAHGHHGVALSRSHATLVTRFSMPVALRHGINLEGGALLNVASRGGGVDLVLDLHRAGPWGNLFSDLDMGAGLRVFDAGGRGDRGAHGGRQNTFWNLRTGGGSGGGEREAGQGGREERAGTPDSTPPPVPETAPTREAAGSASRRLLGNDHGGKRGGKGAKHKSVKRKGAKPKGARAVMGSARARMRRRLAESGAERMLRLPSCEFGPLLNFVGPFAGARCKDAGWLVAGVPDGKPDLHTSQVEARRDGGLDDKPGLYTSQVKTKSKLAAAANPAPTPAT